MNLKDRVIDIITGKSSDDLSQVRVCIGRYHYYDSLVKSYDFDILQFHKKSIHLQREGDESIDSKLEKDLPILIETKNKLKKATEQKDIALDLLIKAIEKEDLKYIKYLKDGGSRLRKNMPQLDHKNIEGILERFEDADIKVKEKSVKITKIKPSQKDFDDNKVLSMMKKGSDKIDVKYLISKDNFLVDGHHRWATALEEDDSQKIDVYQIDLPIKDLLSKVKKFNIACKNNEEKGDVIEKAQVDAALTILEAAYQNGQIEENEIIKARDLSHLIPVRRQITRNNGTVYMKTVYVKKEEVVDKKARKYVAQDDYEERAQVGDNVKINFVGWSTGTPYEGVAKIDRITNDFIEVSLTENVETHNRNNFVYRVGGSNSTFKVPRTTSKNWDPKLRISPLAEEAPQVASENTRREIAPTHITQADQVSRGDTVRFEQGGVNITGQVTYIWVQSSNKVRLTIKTEDGRTFYKQIDGRVRIYKVGYDEGSDSPTSANAETHTTTDQDFASLRSLGVTLRGSEADFKQVWNGNFKNFNSVEFVKEMRAVLKNKFGPTFLSVLNMKFSTNGNEFSFEADRGDAISMTRRFKLVGNSVAEEKKQVDHAYFKLGGSSQGGDLGKKLFKVLNKQYVNMGIQKLKVSANIDVGAYAWGKYGFRTDIRDAEELTHNFERAVGTTRSIKHQGQMINYTLTQADVNEAKKRVASFKRRNPSNTPFPMALLCNISEGKAGKHVLARSGVSWPGHLNLEDVQQRTEWENYINSTR